MWADARAVSIYRYIAEERGLHPGLVAFEQVMSGYGGPAVQYAKLTAGRVGITHWNPQLPPLLAACRFLRGLKIIRLEPNVLLALDSVVEYLHDRQRAVAAPNVSSTAQEPPFPPPPRLPIPTIFTRRSPNNKTAASWANKIKSGGCPWQCYFQVCGQPCLDGMLEHYSMDVLYLGYESVASVEQLWQGSRGRAGGDAEAIAAAPAYNRTAECVASCPLLKRQWESALRARAAHSRGDSRR